MFKGLWNGKENLKAWRLNRKLTAKSLRPANINVMAEEAVKEIEKNDKAIEGSKKERVELKKEIQEKDDKKTPRDDKPSSRKLNRGSTTRSRN
jgi:hypothetical protein